MKLFIQLQCAWYATLFSVYTPTFQANEDTEMIFYEALSTAIIWTPKW